MRRRLLVVLGVFVTFAGCAEGFSLKKKERRPAFQGPGAAQELLEDGELREVSDSGVTDGNDASYAFALPPNFVVQLQKSQFVRQQEEDAEIGYGTAIASCLLSIALGYGLGYGT